MARRLTIGLVGMLSVAAAASTGAAQPSSELGLQHAQFSALPPGAPLNPHPRDLPRVPTVGLDEAFEVMGGVGDGEDADPYGGGYGYGGNVYLPQQPGRGFPLPRVRPLPPNLRPPISDGPQLRIGPPAIGGGTRVNVS